MESWLKTSSFLCFFGFLRELRPSEPYHAEFILGGWFNITQEEVNREVYPIGTYSYLILLVVVFLITDFLRYKPIIIANAVTGIVFWGLLIWTSTLQGLQIGEIFYGFYQAAEVAYYTYIYAMVKKEFYPRVTSQTRAAMFVGKLVAGVLAQVLITFNITNYKQLVYVSLGSQVVAMFWACYLPKVQQSIYFHRKTKRNVVEELPREASFRKDDMASENNAKPLQLLWTHACNAYKNPVVFKWSLWYAVSVAGYLQVTSYMQVLWKSFENEQTVPNATWNGAVDAGLTALAALFALMAGYLRSIDSVLRNCLIVLAVFSEGGCILLATWTSSIFMSYIGYIIFGGLYSFTITVASAELACGLVEDSFALIFGINTLVALLFQTILTIVVISDYGLGLGPFQQFTVYAFYFITIGIIYLLGLIGNFGLILITRILK